jgi:hypothetical protein
MTTKITCIIMRVNQNHTNNWNFDLRFKSESNSSNTWELSLAVWMGALLNNVGDEKCQDRLWRKVDPQ